MNISEEIRVLCARYNVSLAELARRLGKSPQTFNAKMKRGSFTISELETIATALGATFKVEFIVNKGENKNV